MAAIAVVFQNAGLLSTPPAVLQLTKGADGLPVVIGEGAHAVVMLGRLQGMPVAVKVSALWSCWAGILSLGLAAPLP